MNIVLTGYMASGKTVVGTCLSELLDRRLIDTDREIEKKCGLTIPQIFKASGEEYFRHAESEVIRELSGLDGCVIATGGGVVLNTENVANLRKNGVIVNLDPEETVIIKRLSGKDATRPLANGSSIDEILERFRSRSVYYDNCDIKIKITPEKGIADVANEIINILEDKYEGEFRSSR